MLQQRYKTLYFEEESAHTLFSTASLPFSLSELPTSFSKFRKLVEPLITKQPIMTIEALPPYPEGCQCLRPSLPSVRIAQKSAMFRGGSDQAEKHLFNYFNSRLPSDYKQVRNELDGWEKSTKFSPWLANGSLSVNTILHQLKTYEETIEVNQSTYWISFELLWREYFQWVSHIYSVKMFTQNGVKHKKILSSFYPERFQRWCNGNTPFPLVNACMKQLNATGFMSNRGRQIVASCFVNELQLDWRYGAAYFEQQLIDYDVASNWGNWQYLAGVGMDSRSKRQFDIEKQTRLYDPNRLFIEKWCEPTDCLSLDSVDAADWPIANNNQDKR